MKKFLKNVFVYKFWIKIIKLLLATFIVVVLKVG